MSSGLNGVGTAQDFEERFQQILKTHLEWMIPATSGWM
jgi:hypothetical protein